MSKSQSEKIRKKFITQLGENIVQWQLVEQLIFEIFVLGVRSKDIGAPAAIFSKIISARLKKDITDAVVQKILPKDDPLYGEWKKTFDLLTESTTKRNNLAHYILSQGYDKKPILRPYYFKNLDLTAEELLQQERIDFDKLVEYEKDFIKTKKSLNSFIDLFREIVRQ